MFSPSSGPDMYCVLLPLGTCTAVFDPIECKQLLLDVSCVAVHSRCKTSHMAASGAYTLSFFRDTGEDRAIPSESLWTLQLKHSRVEFSNPMYFAIFLLCSVSTALGMSLREVSHEVFVFSVFSRNQEKMKPLTWRSVSSEVLQSL